MKTLTRRGLKAAALLLTASLLSACNQENTNVITFVNMDSVLNESGLLAQERTHLEQVRAALEKGAEMAETRYDALDNAQAEAARQSDAQALNVQWQSEQVSARNAVLKVVEAQASALREEKAYTAILPVQSALVLDKKVDVTAALAARLKAQMVSFGALPQVTLKEEKPAVKDDEKPQEKAKGTAGGKP